MKTNMQRASVWLKFVVVLLKYISFSRVFIDTP